MGKMKPPTHTVYMNATAAAVKPGTPPKEICELLKKQLTSTVLWEPSVRNMIKAGVTEFYEVGPMKQIKAMMKRIDSKVWGSTSNVEVCVKGVGCRVFRIHGQDLLLASVHPQRNSTSAQLYRCSPHR